MVNAEGESKMQRLPCTLNSDGGPGNSAALMMGLVAAHPRIESKNHVPITGQAYPREPASKSTPSFKQVQAEHNH